MAQELHKITVNLNTKSDQALEGAVRMTGDNRTDSINRALQIYEYLLAEQEKGAHIYVGDIKAGELQLLKLL